MYYMYTSGGCVRTWDPRIHSALRLTRPFWTRQREAAVWNFKGKGSNSQVNEKKRTFGKPYCAGHPGMMGHKGDSVAGIVPVAILNSYM